MFGWSRDKLFARSRSPLDEWSVRFEGGCIVTSDGSEATHRLLLSDLRKVIVQTDDSGPWGSDVLYFLFTQEPQPAGVFPIEARSREEFVNWLRERPGYRDHEHIRAMGSTQVARFVIYEVGS